mmetsp:Transcript_39679/g.119216  ORF Transcript_39679/g.119216 Transcript_39679/m.119216 type:complete len:99 (+) Transcript_39679:659-955(+)
MDDDGSVCQRRHNADVEGDGDGEVDDEAVEEDEDEDEADDEEASSSSFRGFFFLFLEVGRVGAMVILITVSPARDIRGGGLRRSGSRSGSSRPRRYRW